jgi:hypothetical protein
MSVLGIDLFARPWLIKPKNFILVVVGSVVVFATGVWLELSPFHSLSGKPLFLPLISVTSHWLLRKLFVGSLHHEPRDTFQDWSPNLGWDRAFNIIFWVGNMLMLLYLVAPSS